MCRRALALTMLLAGSRVEAATLSSAHVTLQILDDGTCDVRIEFVANSDAAALVNHRLLVGTSARAGEVAVAGAASSEASRQGTTLVVPISLEAGETRYTARYRVQQARGLGRCGLLVPDAPTTGADRAVQIDAVMPAGVQRLPGEFPAMTWREQSGTARVGHMPAFASVPYAAAGDEVGWYRSLDVRRALDTAAAVFLVAASAIWAGSRRRRR